MTNRGKMVVGMTAGAIAGAVIGLLIAPVKGSHMRRRVINTPRVWVNNLGRLITKGSRKIEAEKVKTRQRKVAAEERVNKLKQGLG